MKSAGVGKKKVKVEKIKDYVNWFEIPAYNIDRAVAFYGNIYSITMEVSVVGDYAMAFFPTSKGVGGAVVQGEGCIPQATGTLLYLSGGRDLNNVLSRIDDAGGKVIMPKTLINEDNGYFALFLDTEGNRLALHSVE